MALSNFQQAQVKNAQNYMKQNANDPGKVKYAQSQIDKINNGKEISYTDSYKSDGSSTHYNPSTGKTTSTKGNTYIPDKPPSSWLGGLDSNVINAYQKQGGTVVPAPGKQMPSVQQPIKPQIPQPVNQNLFSGLYGQPQMSIPQPQVVAASPPSFSQSALNRGGVSGGSAQYSPSALVGVRDEFEKQGYKVDWNPSMKSVILTDPNGLSTTLNQGDYQNKDGHTYITKDKFNSIVGGTVPPRQNIQQPLSYEQIQKQVQDRINQQIQARQNQAKSMIDSYQRSFDNNMSTIRDNRVLENLQFERNNNPYSGGSDYRRAMMDRQRTLSDSQAQQQLGAQIGQVNQGLNDYIQGAQTESEKMIQDQVNQERSYQLQLDQLGLQKDKFNWEKDYQSGQLSAQQENAKADILLKQIDGAMERLDKIGQVATPEDAELLGVPVGTPSYEAKKAASLLKLDLAKFQETQDYHNKTLELRGKELQNRTESQKGGPAGNKDAYSSWTGFYTKKLGELKNKPSIQELEADVRSSAGDLADQGYEINDVIDALYNAYYNGQFPTKKAYQSWINQQDKEYKKNNPGAYGPPNLSTGFNQQQKGGEIKLTGNKTVDRWSQPIQQASSKHGVPPQLLFNMMMAESAGNPTVRSTAGAIGLMQFMPGTADGMGIDPTDPMQSINGAAQYLKGLYNQFGDWKLAAAAYNAGPGNVKKYGGIPPFKETQNYVKKVFS